ncbi:hypothetical protein [Azospirillum argentinense]|uniref:hypothetical protein n=1 Tax=Azospirillum argentinense TaxID=2970906 RepID=UPI0032DF708F
MSDPTDFLHTDKQAEILRHVLAAADAGAFLDIHALKKRLSYGAAVTVQAVDCSLRFLERHGMLERFHAPVAGRGAYKRVHVKPTPRAYTVFRGGP